MKKRLWTRDEFILTFNLYLKLASRRLNSNTPEVKELAGLLGRSANSIALRLVNFAACDPYLVNRGAKGMVGGLGLCQPIWDEFANDKELLVFESERILAEKQYGSIEAKFDALYEDIKIFKGESKIREIKTRINQNIFRAIVIANYDNRCAITGINIPELLIASHIIPWSMNAKERLNPENGICLSALYDRAFDRGLIGIDNHYKIVLSKTISYHSDKDYFAKYFDSIKGKKIHMPLKYNPNPRFLEWHMDEVFVR